MEQKSDSPHTPTKFTLPLPAVERIQHHLYATIPWKKDPRRYVVPLVSRQWRLCQALAPKTWSKVVVSTHDVFIEGCCPKKALERMVEWFDRHAAEIEHVVVDIQLPTPVTQALIESLESTIIKLLIAVSPTVQSLAIIIQGGGNIVARAWHAAAHSTPSNFPNLSSLCLFLLSSSEVKFTKAKESGHGGGFSCFSEAADAQHAFQGVACIMPALCPVLTELCVQFQGIRLYSFPENLRDLETLKTFKVIYDKVLSFQIPIKDSITPLPLPPNLHRLVLCNPPFRQCDVLTAVEGQLKKLDALVLEYCVEQVSCDKELKKTL